MLLNPYRFASKKSSALMVPVNNTDMKNVIMCYVHGDTIDGAASLTIAPLDSIRLISDGSTKFGVV